jgi:tRNA-2-methylthio-N6-dimethylallyladenosine synthase
MRRIEWMRNAKRKISITSDIIVGFPGETEEDLEQTLSLQDEVQFDSIFTFKYSKRPNTPALKLEDHISEDEKTRRLTIVMEKQRTIQMRINSEYLGTVEEVLVEGFNKATGQWISRTSQHKTLNFNHAASDVNLAGTFLPVMVTRAGPHSLVGESVV